MEYVTFPDCEVSNLKFGYFGRVILASGFLLLARAPHKGVRMESRGFYSQLVVAGTVDGEGVSLLGCGSARPTGWGLAERGTFLGGGPCGF